jgi:hypothetical protein
MTITDRNSGKFLLQLLLSSCGSRLRGVVAKLTGGVDTKLTKGVGAPAVEATYTKIDGARMSGSHGD